MTATIDRRALLQGSFATAVLSVGWRSGAVTADAHDLNDWLRVASDGMVTVRVNCVEMGQGSQTGFAQIVADELDADWQAVRVEQAPVDKRWYNPWDNYMTGGSASIRNHIEKLRRMGASARIMLVRAAAAGWGVAPDTCETEAGRVLHRPSGRSAAYGNLIADAAKLAPDPTPPLKPRERWRFMGQTMPRLDLPSKVDGSAVYGVDVRQPGMLVATLAQCPQFGGRLERVDESPALAVPGVRRVVRLEGAVVVVADGYWAASKGLAALAPRWTPGKTAGVSSPAISARLLEETAKGGATPAFSDPAVTAARRIATKRAFANAERRFEATYEVPLLAHATLEPMNATALVDCGRAELWVPTQVQSDMRTNVAKALGFDEAAVTIHTTQIGGGFGRRLQTDYGVLAALVAREFDVPVKLMWSRSEDMQHGFYRPQTVARLQAALDADGLPIGFRADVACVDTGPWGGLTRQPYDLGASDFAVTTWNPGIPLGAWRSVDWTQNTFFVECFIDELAAAVGADPLTYRERLLANNPRVLRLLRAAADRAGWRTPPLAGRHRGIGLCVRDDTGCVEIVELTASPEGPPKIHRITVAIDCGTAINPGQISAQVESGVTMALGAALRQAITLKDGRVEQAYFDSYPMVHMADMPLVDTVIVESPGEQISGVGEPPVPPLAPALCNALFAATGRRSRSLPLFPI